MQQGMGEKLVFRCSTNNDVPVFVSGNLRELGEWDPQQALAMQRQETGGSANDWTCHLTVQHGQTIEFKFMKRIDGHIVWERGDNRRFTVIPGPHAINDAFRE